MRWKLVAKWLSSTVVAIGMVYESGNSFEVARIAFPDDRMIGETTKCVDLIIKLLKQRYKNSV